MGICHGLLSFSPALADCPTSGTPAGFPSGGTPVAPQRSGDFLSAGGNSPPGKRFFTSDSDHAPPALAIHLMSPETSPPASSGSTCFAEHGVGQHGIKKLCDGSGTESKRRKLPHGQSLNGVCTHDSQASYDFHDDPGVRRGGVQHGGRCWQGRQLSRRRSLGRRELVLTGAVPSPDGARSPWQARYSAAAESRATASRCRRRSVSQMPTSESS